MNNRPVSLIVGVDSTIGSALKGDYQTPIGKALPLKEGDDVSIVSMSHMAIEALYAVDVLEKQGVSCDLIDLRTIKSIDWQLIFNSVRKTGPLLALDTGWETGSVAGEIVAGVAMSCFDSLKQALRRLALPDYPTPTSPSLTKPFYKRAEDIVSTVSDMVGKDVSDIELSNQRDYTHDVPGNWFKGPF